MYIARGKVSFLKSYEDIIGKYGIHHEAVRSYNLTREMIGRVSVLGSERLVNSTARRLRRQGIIPEYLGVEHITSIEQAEKYRTASPKEVTITRMHDFDLAEQVQRKIPDGAELTDGTFEIWKETRFPTPYIYVAAMGRLLARAQYDPQNGWHAQSNVYESLNSGTVGLMTPILNLSLTAKYTRS